jgi:uncharacterized protein YkwD
MDMTAQSDDASPCEQQAHVTATDLLVPRGKRRRPTVGAAAVWCAAAALVLSAACVAPPAPSGRGATVTDSDLALCVSEANRYRSMVGLPPFARSATLEAYAADGAQQDAATRVAHHHFTATGGGGVATAENEYTATGSTLGTIADVIRAGMAAMWAEGPKGEHYQNLVSPYASTGCGIYVDEIGMTWTEDFR